MIKDLPNDVEEIIEMIEEVREIDGSLNLNRAQTDRMLVWMHEMALCVHSQSLVIDKLTDQAGLSDQSTH